MNVIGCAVAKVRNAETQHWRGLLRDCAIARLARHVRVMRVGVVCIVRELLHIMRESATAQSRNYLCVVRVVVLRTRATAQLGLFFFKRRKEKGMVHIAVSELKRRIGAAIWRDWWAAAMASGALGSATTAASVVSPLSTPPVGTPSTVRHGGNSRPARALVAGLGKSERCGEPKGAK